MKFLSILKLRLYDDEPEGFVIWQACLTAKEARNILDLGIEFYSKKGPEYLASAEVSGRIESFLFKTSPGDRFHALICANDAIRSKIERVYYFIRNKYYEYCQQRQLTKPQKLHQFKAMRLIKDSPSNDPEYLVKGMFLDDYYLFLGELTGVPGHVLVYNYSRGVMLPGIWHPERFEAIPLDEL